MLTFDINVLWLSKCIYLPGHVIENHKHDIFHYVYIIDGTGFFTIGSNEYMIQEDEFYLTPAGIYHSYTAEKTKGLKTIEIKFKAGNSAIASKLADLNGQIELLGNKIRHVLENLISEGMNKDIYYNDMINVKFTAIILELLRYNESKKKKDLHETDDIYAAGTKESVRRREINLDNALLYMKNNYSLRIELDTLTRISGMSKFYFCRTFKSIYGMSPIQYLNWLKILHAKEMMRYSNYNITQIASIVGFEDIHYFSRYFKKKEGLKPIEYMKKMKGSLYIQLTDNIHVTDNTHAFK